MAGNRTRRTNTRLRPEQGHPIRIDINGENFLDVVYALDISVAGARIAVPHRFEGCRLDKMVNLVINLPDPVNSSFVTLGSIRHLSGRAFGVKFVGLENSDYRLVRDYVGHLLAQRSGWQSFLFRFGLRH